jgi:hypothetical protein
MFFPHQIGPVDVLARNYQTITPIIDCEAELPDVHGSLAERPYCYSKFQVRN